MKRVEEEVQMRVRTLEEQQEAKLRKIEEEYASKVTKMQRGVDDKSEKDEQKQDVMLAQVDEVRVVASAEMSQLGFRITKTTF